MARERAFGTVTPAQVRDELATGRRLLLVDVREPLEHRIASVDGFVLVPLGELVDAVDRLDREADVVVMCHHGIRSASACEFLVRNGFGRVRNLSGGIDRWSVEVDRTIPRY